MTTTTNKEVAKGFQWAVPKELGIPPDLLRLRLDFFHQSCVMTSFESDSIVQTKLVDASDVAHALASDLSFGTGLLPDDTLWWQTTRRGPIYAIYERPGVHRLTLQLSMKEPPKRFNVPLPGFIFLCSPEQAPYVYAVTKKPTKKSDLVYKAPLLNIFQDGRSCAGTNKYPARVEEIIHSFFISFFTLEGERQGRSKKFPKEIFDLWKELDGKNNFPIADLVQMCTVNDLMNIGVSK
jgi:hypothetical protein